jgi:hypothetical protein
MTATCSRDRLTWLLAGCIIFPRLPVLYFAAIGVHGWPGIPGLPMLPWPL